MSYGEALRALKQGKKLARAGWNGKGLWLLKADGGTFQIDGLTQGDLTPFIVIKTVDGKFAPWAASQTDALAEDWEVVS
jgi:hypothetical protein